VYLQEVVLSGFKSYATETVVNFKSGIGVIIGNNGVGKTNVLDAIAWAVGESDLQRLRCQQYGDLFFSGSQEYPPAETARVALTIKLGEDKKAPQVKLTRQARRQGTEEFFCDGVELTAAGYYQKLTELGLENVTKTVIRQGQVDSFLQMGPAERFKYVKALFNEKVDGDLIGRINAHFQSFLGILVPEGGGELFPVDAGGEPGLAIEVFFPGKGKKNPLLFSGGEKAICSLAASLALFEELHSPIYLLDEVEPALDWIYHHHMQQLFRRLAQHRQLIMITHLRSTIELADTLHGIRARRDGTSYAKFYFDMDERILRAYQCCC
jgi:chromosome segregation protein